MILESEIQSDWFSVGRVGHGHRQCPCSILSSSQRQAIIKLLEKREKDKRFINNWRPISLLNVDTKIISKAIANKLKSILPSIISHDQTAYVKGRFICESTRLISDILEITDTQAIC